jgi:hypothetical protein
MVSPSVLESFFMESLAFHIEVGHGFEPSLGHTKDFKNGTPHLGVGKLTGMSHFRGIP